MPIYARLVRSSTLTIKEIDFVLASRAALRWPVVFFNARHRGNEKYRARRLFFELRADSAEIMDSGSHLQPLYGR